MQDWAWWCTPSVLALKHKLASPPYLLLTVVINPRISQVVVGNIVTKEQSSEKDLTPGSTPVYFHTIVLNRNTNVIQGLH